MDITSWWSLTICCFSRIVVSGVIGRAWRYPVNIKEALVLAAERRKSVAETPKMNLCNQDVLWILWDGTGRSQGIQLYSHRLCDFSSVLRVVWQSFKGEGGLPTACRYGSEQGALAQADLGKLACSSSVAGLQDQSRPVQI